MQGILRSRFTGCNAAPVQLIPATVLSLRISMGSAEPGIIILPAVLSSMVALTAGIILCKVMEKHSGGRP